MTWRSALLSIGVGALASSCSSNPDILIELSGGGCMGACPVYKLAIQGDGRVIYSGRSFVLADGDYSWTIPAEDVSKLVDLFAQVGCASGSELEHQVFDVGSRVATLTTNQGTMAVENSGIRECQTDIAGGGNIYSAIDDISGAADLIEVHDRTLPMLERVGIDFRSQKGADILLRSLASRHVALARELINRGAPVLGGRIIDDEDDSAPAIVAVPRLADVDLARLIIDKGGLPDSETRTHFLAMSAASGCPEMTKLALQHTGELSASQLSDMMFFAASARMEKSGTYWQKLYARPDHASWVECFDPPAVFRLLLAAGANATDRTGTGTALHTVSDAVSARLLIDAGADANAVNLEGRTALHETDDAEIAKALIEAGADVNARDRRGNTPLFGRYGADIVRVLLEAGAEPHARNAFGWTALFAVSDGDAAKLLIEAGIDVNARDGEGRTALEFMKDLETAMTLLTAGARASTPAALEDRIVWATRNEREDLARALRESRPLDAPP